MRKLGEKTDEGIDVMDIFMCSGTAVSPDEMKEIKEQASLKGISMNPRIEKVSRWPAYTAQQFSEFKVLWPTSLRKDTTR